MTLVQECKECGEPTNNEHFCSRVCVGKFQSQELNKNRPRIKSVCPLCGGPKYYESNRCQDCRTNQWWDDALNRPISKMFNRGGARVKYAKVRTWARKLMEKAGRLEKCELCDFSLIVEVSHIRSISDFPDDTLMKVVNAQENMMALCPNHHAMFEKGLLELSSN